MCSEFLLLCWVFFVCVVASWHDWCTCFAPAVFLWLLIMCRSCILTECVYLSVCTLNSICSMCLLQFSSLCLSGHLCHVRCHVSKRHWWCHYYCKACAQCILLQIFAILLPSPLNCCIQQPSFARSSWHVWKMLYYYVVLTVHFKLISVFAYQYLLFCTKNCFFSWVL